MATAHGHSGQPAASMLPQPQAVGSQFVAQYYSVLHKSPQHLHRFYTDQSTMTYSTGNKDVQQLNSQQSIHDKVMSLNYQDAVTEIYSVDSQYSLSEGVIVQVTGSLQCTDRPKKNFTQTFFLATQDKGYYVHNDLFHVLADPPAAPHGYGGGRPQENGYAAPPASLRPPIEHPPQLNGGQQIPQHVAPPPQQPAPPIPAPTVAPPPPQSQASAPVPASPAPATTPTPPQAPTPTPPTEAAPKESELEAAPAPDAAPAAQDDAAEPAAEAATPEAESESPPPPAEPEAPAAPLTYAERLKQGAKATPKPQAPRPAPQSKPAADSAAPAAAAAGSAEGNGVEGAAQAGGFGGHDEAPGRSIFVNDLPADITPERLAQAFAEFGELAGARAVNLKAQKDKPPFAFIDFKEESAAAAAIAGPVVIDGHAVRVDEKKPLYLLRGGRGGRGEYGRGGRFDGAGRGYYGRGPGRGDFVPRGGYPMQDGGRGRGPSGGRGPRPMGGRGSGPPRDMPGRGAGGRGAGGGRGPRVPAPGGAPPTAALTPAEAGAASS